MNRSGQIVVSSGVAQLVCKDRLELSRRELFSDTLRKNEAGPENPKIPQAPSATSWISPVSANRVERAMPFAGMHGRIANDGNTRDLGQQTRRATEQTGRPEAGSALLARKLTTALVLASRKAG
jgi:hypothetical protein